MNHKIQRFAKLAATVCSGLLLLAAQPSGARPLDAILSSGEIRVGVNPEYPPTSKYDDKNELVGFDVDVSNRLASMLGVKAVFVIVNASSRVPFVTSGKIDYVMGGMTRTTERAKLIDFTLPINTESMGVVTLASKPFNSPSDLNKAGVTIAEVRGTTGAKLAAAKFPEAKLLELDNHPDVLRAVAQGRADAVVEDLSYLGQIMTTVKAPWRTLKEPVGDVYYDSLGVAKADTTLRNWLNVAIFELNHTGVTAEIWRKWYGVDMLVPVPVNPAF
ncbi:MAG: transporter substrate-binding domain-containing protein [Variovorax sp.]